MKRRQTSSGMAKTDGVATPRRQVALKVKVLDGPLCLWRCGQWKGIFVPKRNDLRRWRYERWHSGVYSIALFVRGIPFVFQPSVGAHRHIFLFFFKFTHFWHESGRHWSKWQRCTVKGAPFNLNSGGSPADLVQSADRFAKFCRCRPLGEIGVISSQ